MSVSIFGTMAADVMHVGLGIAHVVSTIFFAATLAKILATWYPTQATLFIHSITAKRREALLSVVE